jgi:2-polyprenyl-3-methyl-5-hydroxy-6-metoxy-1,4-benzoquinol methylase
MPRGDPFEGKAEWFDEGYRTSAHGRLRLQLVMARLMATLPPPPARILDAGGGTGAFAVPLARLGYDVTVLDSSAEWLEVARRSVAGSAEPERRLRVRFRGYEPSSTW